MLEAPVTPAVDDRAVDLGRPARSVSGVSPETTLVILVSVCSLVAGVDALGRVADVEVLLPLAGPSALEHRDADLLGRAGVDGRLVDDDRAALQVPADDLGTLDQRVKVGLVRLVDRRRHRHDDEVGVGEHGRIVGVGEEAAALKSSGPTSPVGSTWRVSGDLFFAEVEADRAVLLAELDGERQPHVAQADNGDAPGGHLLYLWRRSWKGSLEARAALWLAVPSTVNQLGGYSPVPFKWALLP